jgi:DNA polymerase III subunit gamma/tau
MSYLPFHHKYRPQTFADLVGQEAIAATLTNALRLGKVAPAYLFTGPRGTGKTSSARIFAKSLNCTASATPTAEPCGQCPVCRSITAGNAMDVIEIDAASNTGVDNIRELIERAQYAPVQCRYKVYTIDECLTGDALVLTSTGLMRIDDPQIEGKKVLSYNDDKERWEYKQVVRQLNQGERQTFVIQTTNREIRCTDNHLIRTDKGWIPARNLKAGMKILSPVNVDATLSSPNLGQMDVKKLSLGIGSVASTKQDLSGGTLMMDRSALPPKEVHKSSFIQKDFHNRKTILSPTGSLDWDTLLRQSITREEKLEKHITTSGWGQMPVENGWRISSNTPFPQWHTSLETIKSVCLGGVEQVYDIEVADNHNFVANGLLVHNCHMLSTAAFNSLLKTLEEPPNRVVFILATTDPQRVLPTIISRCQKFDYRRIPLESMIGHLDYIAQNEQMSIDPAALRLVAQISQGGLRDAESLLDQLSLVGEQVTIDRVWDLVGAVPEGDLLKICIALHQGDLTTVIDRCRQLIERGKEPLTVLQNLTSFYRDLSIAKTAPQRPDLTSLTSETWQQAVALAAQLDLASILNGQQRLKEGEAQLKGSNQPHLWLEIALLSLLPMAQTVPNPTPAKIADDLPLSTKAASNHPSTPAPQTTPALPAASQDKLSSEPPTMQAPLAASNHQSPPEPLTTQAPLAASNHQSNSEPPMMPEIEEDPLFDDLPEPEPDIPIVPVAETYDLPIIWQQVLQQLQPSGKGLFTPHGVLLSISENVAIVGMKSITFSKLAEGQKPHLQKALSNILGRSIAVNIQLATATKAKAPTNPPPTSEIAPASTPPTPQVIAPPAAISAPPSPASNPVSNRVIADLNDEILEEVENDFGEEETTLPWDEPAPLPPVVAEEPQMLSLFDAVPPSIPESISIPVIPPAPSPAPPEPSPNIPDSFTLEELDAAAQNLADRFGGEVVEEYVTLWDL